MSVRVIDPGHVYEVDNIDGSGKQLRTYVKREGDGFPGNVGHHEGTTMQHEFRVLLDRMAYLQNQIPCEENIQIIRNIMNSLYLLEHRAMRRHGLNAESLTQYEAAYGPMCKICGHVRCEHLQ